MTQQLGPEIDRWLHSLPKARLIAIMESAGRSLPGFPELLEQMRSQAVRGSAAEAERALARLPSLERYRGRDWDCYTTGFADDTMAVLDPILAAAQERPDPALLPPLGQAVTSLAAALEFQEECDEVLNDAVEELVSAVHQVAIGCAEAMTDDDRAALAQWLWRGTVDIDNYADIDVSVNRFADVLGPVGLDRYRTLVESAPPDDHWRASGARQDLALLAEDPEAVLAAFGGRLDSAAACWAVVRPLTEIGRADLALEQARRGFALGPKGQWDTAYTHLADVLVDDALRQDDPAGALDVRVRAFEAAPNRTSYTQLRQTALDQGQWAGLQAGAEARLAERAPHDWDAELLDQDRIDEAWQFARGREDTLRYGLWPRLLAARGQTHPQDVLQHYRAFVDQDLTTTGHRRYESAAGWLVLLRGFAEAADQHDWFAAYLRQLWDDARRRPACREIFAQSGLVPDQE